MNRKSMIAFIVFLLSTSAYPCMNQLPESELIKAIALSPGTGSVTCAQKPNEPCICFDGLGDWEVLSYVDVQIDDPEKPIYERASNVQECKNPDQCESLISTHCPEFVDTCKPEEYITYCDQDHTAYYRKVEDTFEAYCTKLLGYEQKTVKRLMEDSVKKAAKVARKLLEDQAEQTKKINSAALKQRIKSLADQSDLTNLEVKEAIFKLIKLKSLLGEL